MRCMQRGDRLTEVKDTVKQENERKKEYLNGYKRLCDKIKQLGDQAESIQCEIENAKVQQLSDMPKGGKQTDLSDYIVRLEEINEQINDILKVLRNRKIKIEKSIASMKDGTESRIIRLRYIEFKQWEQICVDIGYSWRQTHYIHGRALNNIEV